MHLPLPVRILLSYVSLLLISILSFQLKEFTLTFLVGLVQWWWTLLVVACLEKKSLSTLNNIARESILAWKVFYSPSALWIYYVTSIRPKIFAENLLIVFWHFPCIKQFVLLLLLLIFFFFFFYLGYFNS